MRVYDPGNVAQWVLQYLRDNAPLMPSAGPRPTMSGGGGGAAPLPASEPVPGGTGASVPDLSGILGAIDGGGSDGGGSAPPSVPHWTDPFGRPITPGTIGWVPGMK